MSWHLKSEKQNLVYIWPVGSGSVDLYCKSGSSPTWIWICGAVFFANPDSVPMNPDMWSCIFAQIRLPHGSRFANPDLIHFSHRSRSELLYFFANSDPVPIDSDPWFCIFFNYPDPVLMNPYLWSCVFVQLRI